MNVAINSERLTSLAAELRISIAAEDLLHCGAELHSLGRFMVLRGGLPTQEMWNSAWGAMERLQAACDAIEAEMPEL